MAVGRAEGGGVGAEGEGGGGGGGGQSDVLTASVPHRICCDTIDTNIGLFENRPVSSFARLIVDQLSSNDKTGPWSVT